MTTGFIIGAGGGIDGGSGLELCDIGMALYVDETKGLRRYLNGQIVDINTNTQAFLNRLLEIKNTNPELFTTESNWQSEATLNIDGCVYKFVLNYSGADVVSVRLPKYPDYVEINAGGTLPVVGNGMTLGLTNGPYYGALNVDSTTGSTIVTQAAYGQNVSTSSIAAIPATVGILGVTTDETKSGIQTTLKQTKLKMRYFIQVATGSETENNIVNDIELNNPYSLFECKYADHELFNLSWLVSNGSYNGSNAVHPSAYQALLVENNAEITIGSTVTLPNGTEYTKQGLSVKLSTETYTDYDFVLNTTDGTFRLPIKPRNLNNTRYLIEKGEQDGVSYRIYADGYCEQWGQRGAVSEDSTLVITLLKPYKNTNYNVFDLPHFTNSTTQYRSGCGYKNKTTSSFTLLQDTFADNGGNWFTCGYLADGEYTPLTDNILLYYYVGETVQNANLINAGRIGETMATKSMVDGQWVTKAQTFAKDISLTQDVYQTFDLSDYLPNDGYNYEVLFTITSSTGTTSGNTVDISAKSDIMTSGTYRVVGCVTRSSSTAKASSGFLLPVGLERTVAVRQIHTSTCKLNFFRAVAYRRIGTNV